MFLLSFFCTFDSCSEPLFLILENSVKGLQEDEVAFLDHVSDQQIAIEKARNTEEARVIRELKISFYLWMWYV